MRTRLYLALLTLSLAPHTAGAQCATWAEGYGPGGMNGTVSTMKVLDVDGSGPELYAGGEYTLANGESSGVARWNGEQWEPFGAWSIFRDVHALGVYDAGNGPRLYAAGYSGFLTPPFDSLASWNGVSWEAVPGAPNGDVRSLAVFNNELYVGGYFLTLSTGQYVYNLARWNGSAWSGVGGANSPVHELVVHDDGTGPALYAAGEFNEIGGQAHRGIARWNGSVWSAVGTNTMHVRALGIHDFGSGPNLVVGGGFSTFGGGTTPLTARWDGNSWIGLPGLMSPSTAATGAREFLTVGSGPSAELYAGGEFSFDAVTGPTNVARWTGTAWAPLANGVQGAVESLASFDDGTGTQLFAGGEITAAGGLQVQHAARWDGVAWHAVGATGGLTMEGIDASEGVWAAAHYDDGTGEALHVAGKMRGAGSLFGNVIARRSGTDWASLGSVAGSVYALEVFDDGSGPKLYAGGDFTAIGGVSVRGVARFNGTSWEEPPFVGGMSLQTNSNVWGLRGHDDGSGPALYVAGQLYFPGGFAFVARWSANGWSLVGTQSQTCPGTMGFGADLAVHDDGGGPALYLMGHNVRFDCEEFGGVAKWDGATWTKLGSGLLQFGVPGFPAPLRAGASFDDGQGPALYVGGSLQIASGTGYCRNVARWRNGAWEPLANGTEGSSVDALAVFDDGRGDGPALYVGGSLYVIGGVERVALGRWQRGAWGDANGWGPRGTLNIGSVRTLLSCVSAGERALFAGGWFLTTGTVGSAHIARLDACAEAGRTYCFGDGTGTACPCGNESAGVDRAGCKNSLGFGATLRARGEPSIGDDTLVLDGAHMSNASALYFQGTQSVGGGAGAVFGAGLRCAGGTTARIGTKNNVGGASSYPIPGDASISLRGHVTGPGTRTYQARYRNAFPMCVPELFNLTNAVEIVWRL
jgi:hypothetical protein